MSDIKSAGWMSALSTTANVVGVLAAGLFFDTMRQKYAMPNVRLAKICAGVGGFLPSFCAVILMLVGCNIELAVLLSFLQQFFLGSNAAGAKSNPNYIGPKYAAIIMSIANTFANIPECLTSNCHLLEQLFSAELVIDDIH